MVPAAPRGPGAGSKVTDQHLLAGSKQTGRSTETARRQSSGMANGAVASVTRPGRGSPRMHRRRTMDKPPSGLRTDLTVTAGSVRRSGEEESRRALAGGMAENAGVTWERVDAEDGVLRACPSV